MFELFVEKDWRTKHGKHKSRSYRIWASMIQRCHNELNENYSDYGGRGIKVCYRWKNSFEEFYKDMGDPQKNMTLDRVNNNAGYYPANCRWATMKTQQRNRRDNLRYVFKGKDLTLMEWSEKTGISYDCLRSRFRNGWTAKDALTTTPSRSNSLKRKDRIYHKDETGKFIKVK